MSQGETPTMDARAVIADVLDAHREVDGDKRGWMCLCTWSNPNIADEAYTTDQARAEFRQHVAQSALDALLQPTEPCETCGNEPCPECGSEWNEYSPPCAFCDHKPCPACSGGLVQRPPLVILASTEHDADDRATAVSLLNWVNTSAAADSMDYRLMRQAVKDFLAHRRLRVEGEQPDA